MLFNLSRLPHPTLIFWLFAGFCGYALIPWYIIEDGFFFFDWLSPSYMFDGDYAPAFFLVLLGEKAWLAPFAFFLAIPILVVKRKKNDPVFASTLIFSGCAGLAWMLMQGFSVGIQGWNFATLEAMFGELPGRQFGMGYGGMVTAATFLFVLTYGIAARGSINGDVFVISALGLVVALVGVFVFFPIFRMFVTAFVTEENGYSVMLFLEKITARRIWSIDCATGGVKCGSAVNSLFAALIVAFITTLMGLVFALVVTRTGVKFKAVVRMLSVLPIITPPFVIGLAIILLFGLSGTINVYLSEALDVAPTRWIYGLPGIVLAQCLAYTPIAFLVLIGVVESVSPAMEEAAQTLRASKWQTFRTVTFPLVRPGIANAFLLGFIESMADFGNPLVLGGNYDVLSTEIFFAIVGAQYDQGAAAVLAIVLLSFTLTAFYAQRFWLRKKSYTTITGKGDSGIHPPLPRRLAAPFLSITALWFLFTLLIYGMIIYGSFVELWGVNNDFTLKHYATAFAVSIQEHGVHWKGSAWDSFLTTVMIASLSAPLTAAVGLITAWLLTRKTFPGKNFFEFGTMLSFAIPGTVIGLSYLMAFNLPPIEITGTGVILVVSFIFRNMPVGVRSGIAALSQIDKSLDESSLTLGANSFQTFVRITIPLLRPAIFAVLVFSFVRAMTAISAVIFLVSAEYNLATSYIIGRVENNDYGLAIAYSTALILVMLVAVGLMQLIVGKTKLGRRGLRPVT